MGQHAVGCEQECFWVDFRLVFWLDKLQTENDGTDIDIGTLAGSIELTRD
ncbi:hypothetical protein ACSI5G_004008 [Vibrio vulnificus]